MWADTLFAAERAHVIRIALWAMASIAVGTAIFLLPGVRRRSLPLLRHFALQSVGWGTVELAIFLVGRSSLGLRDLGSARQLERIVWLNCGLDVAYVAIGVTLAVTCWTLGRRIEGVGAGAGIVTQGAALLALHLAFASTLIRLA